jgi:opacity protein-like surface antigen
MENEMKKHAVLFAGCAALLFLAATAESAVQGPYASVNGGIGTLNDADAKGADGTLEFDTDPGIALTGALGYDFGANFRMETELAYQQNDIDTINLKGTGRGVKAAGEISSISGLLNGYYDFTNISPVTPFVSAGIGLTKAELKDVGAFSGNRYLYLLDEPNGTAMAYQVGGGFSYALNYNLALDLKYRYFSAVDLKLDDVEFDYSSHNVYGGIRASF